MTIRESSVAPGRQAVADSAKPRAEKVGVAQNRGKPWLSEKVDTARAKLMGSQGKAVMDAVDRGIAELRLTPLSQLPPEALRAFTERMPKIDLHRHLNGSIPLERLLSVAKELGIMLPANDLEGLRPHVQITTADRPTLPVYLSKFDVIGRVLKNPKVIEELAASTVEDAAKDKLAHVEIRFAPQFMAAAHGLDMEDIVKAVCAGVRKGVDKTKTTARLIIIIARQHGVDQGAIVAKLAAKYKDFGVVAIDLASASEVQFPPGPYAEAFEGARLDALSATCHAGESAGPESIKSAIVDLKVPRVGHASRILEDPEVVALTRKLRTVLECCPTANAQVGAIASFGDHPIYALLQLGVLVALCTDNPAISGITLSKEFERLLTIFDQLTLGDVEQLIQNSVDGAFLTARERAQLGKRVAKDLAAAEVRLLRDIGG
ncbi:MAG: adenosine deaminase [Myxococcota bacterium]|nr:adenosine deaminase [Myxococcota bacterium]